MCGINMKQPKPKSDKTLKQEAKQKQMDELLKTLNTKNKDIITQQFPPDKKQNKVYDLIPHRKNYNYMMDLRHLPEDKKGNRYLLVCVDLGTNEFDIELLKDKTSKSVLTAFEHMFKRPYASVRTDGV